MRLALSPDSRVHINDDVVFQALEGEAVLLNLKSGVYFGLDQVATRIWNLLLADAHISRVVKTLCDEFEVAEDRCTEDVLQFLTELEAKGLVTIS